jgi:hypothetical protein
LFGILSLRLFGICFGISDFEFRICFWLCFPCFYGSHLAQAPEVALGLTEVGGEKRLDQVPGNGWPHGPAAHAKNVHVIVFDTLFGREVVMDQRCANTVNLIRAHRRANPAATDSDSALHLSGGYGLGQRDDIVGIVIALVRTKSSEIDDLMTRSAKPAEQFLLQSKSTMIGGNSNAHKYSPIRYDSY